MHRGGHDEFINMGVGGMDMDDYPDRCPTDYAYEQMEKEHAKAEADQIEFEAERQRLFELFDDGDGHIDRSTLPQRDRMVERIKLWNSELQDIKDDYSDPETRAIVDYLIFVLQTTGECAFHFAERLRIPQQRDAEGNQS